MRGYVLADVEVLAPEAYEEYRERVMATLEPYGGKFVVRGGPVERLEGEWQPHRLVVIEFPSVEQARDWYDSQAYREIIPLRQRNSRGSLILVEGYG